jgi:hypothetical protein
LGVHVELKEAGEMRRLELTAPETVLGSGELDHVVVRDLAPSQVCLILDGPHLLVEGAEELAINGEVIAPHTRRALLPGDEVALSPSTFLSVPERERAAQQTAAILRGMLGGALVPAPDSVPRLVCLTGKDAAKAFPLACDALELGRGLGADLRLRDRSVSRQHALLRQVGGKWFITPVATWNRTAVNGVRVAETVELQDGDVLQLGEASLRMRAAKEVVEESPQSSAPAGDDSVTVPQGQRAGGGNWIIVLGASAALGGAVISLLLTMS